MKKIIISVVALAAFAGAASAAQNRSYDLRDLETLNAYSSDGVYLPVSNGTKKVAPWAVKKAAPMFDHLDERSGR